MTHIVCCMLWMLQAGWWYSTWHGVKRSKPAENLYSSMIKLLKPTYWLGMHFVCSHIMCGYTKGKINTGSTENIWTRLKKTGNDFSVPEITQKSTRESWEMENRERKLTNSLPFHFQYFRKSWRLWISPCCVLSVQRITESPQICIDDCCSKSL